MRKTNAIFFDLDGVVIDSEPVHAKAKKIVLEKFNISYPLTIFDDYKGRTDKEFFEFVAVSLDNRKLSPDLLQASKKLVFEEIINELKLVNGFLSFFQIIKEKSIYTALVSSTSLYSLSLVDKLYNISGMFDLVITEVDTKKHKPQPDPYLKALEKMPAGNRNIVVIEDSPNGIISAKKAGCYVFGLTTSFQGKTLTEAGADEIFGSYEELKERLQFI